MAFFAPMFLAGAAAIGIPWLIHQIRRPEREPVPFSSLIFVPNIKKEIIERRRIQHILLMLLRMLLVLLMALAFTRPYWTSALLLEEEDGVAWRIILLDRSYSMGYENHLQTAKAEASRLLDSFPRTDRVGIIAFDSSAEVLAKHFDPANETAGSIQQARLAVERIQATPLHTDYLAALQKAQQEISTTGMEEDALPEKITLHVISDFHKNGMPEGSAGWKLASRINIAPIDIGTDTPKNVSIQDSAVGAADSGEIRIAAKIKNHLPPEAKRDGIAPSDIRLLMNKEEIKTNSLIIQPGNSSQTTFLVQNAAPSLVEGAPGLIEGSVEIGDDGLNIDNRRYFTFNPEPKKRALIVMDPRDDIRYPSGWFITRALPQDESSPWNVKTIPTRELLNEFSQTPAPDMVLLSDVNENEFPVDALERYVKNGGHALLMLHSTLDSTALNDTLLNAIGWKSEGLRYRQKRASQFTMMSWIDFDHPVFYPMQGARFNDYSQVRFFNHHKLRPADGAEPAANDAVMARFESESAQPGDPAMLDIHLEKGRLLIFAFGFELEWTNFPKSIKFIPLLMETLHYLSDHTERKHDWLVGETLPPPTTNDEWLALLPGQDDWISVEDSTPLKSAQPGIVQWKTAGTAQPVLWADAINIQTKESNFDKITTQEFLLRFSLDPELNQNAITQTQNRDTLTHQPMAKHEFGRIFVILLFAFLILETWYAFHLS